MRNIIDAIYSVITDTARNVSSETHSTNRANQMGEALEEYIKDVFAGTVGDDISKLEKQAKTFIYFGNQNNPPDSMLLNSGIAIEVKKIESNDSALPLNSSYPKAKLYSNSHMISQACRDCETWTVRDMVYTVGVIDKHTKRLKSLAFVYGDDYCADKEVYEKIKTKIKEGTESIPNVEFAETKELGRVNRVDPLGITYLRIRGMWHIENPFKVFNSIFRRDHTKEFNFMAIINEDKLASLPNFNILEKLATTNSALIITDVKIKNPNNPAMLRKAKLITYIV